MSHDADKSQRYIDDALGRFSAFASDPVARNRRAFAYLRGVRRCGDEPLLKELNITVPIIPSAPFDESLGDAEHYMFARFRASDNGDLAGMKALVVGYELKKYLDEIRGTEQKMRTNPKFPVLPASTESITWGLRGAEDGVVEYRNMHAGKSGELGSAVKENANFIKGVYRPN